MKILLFALFNLLFSQFALGDTPPVPKLFKGMQGQKGQYQVDVLEAAGKSAPQRMTICTDNLMKSPGQGKGARTDSRCKYKLLKDTTDEAVIESTCNERTSTVTIHRESANSMLMSMQSTGPRGPQTMKMRYTHLGACRQGQGTVTLDPNSEQCRRMRAQAAKMKDRETAARINAMCGS